MTNQEYRRAMGMDMIREEQRLYDLRPRNGSTHSDYRFVSSVPADGAILRFYADLSSKQESLPAEAEKILYENLWDLYAR